MQAFFKGTSKANKRSLPGLEIQTMGVSGTGMRACRGASNLLWRQTEGVGHILEGDHLSAYSLLGHLCIPRRLCV
jgi:hypothetical protein